MGCGPCIIWFGVLLGILDWFTDVLYNTNSKFSSNELKNAQRTFLMIQPLWYFFLFAVYVGSHTEIQGTGSRAKALLLAPVFMVLQMTKLMGGPTKAHMCVSNNFSEKF
jgi:hypothetical protein